MTLGGVAQKTPLTLSNSNKHNQPYNIGFIIFVEKLNYKTILC